MSIGMLLLLVLGLMILFGMLQRTLDRMALTDRQSLFCVAAIFVGGWLPAIPLGLVSLNIGGALVAAVLTAAAIFGLNMILPSDPVSMPMLDPMLLDGFAGGVIAWLLGRSRRSAFVAGVLGVILADILTGVSLWMKGINQTVHLGGAGALDAIVIAGVTAVLLCELVGEIMERVQAGRARSPGEDGAIEGGRRI